MQDTNRNRKIFLETRKLCIIWYLINRWEIKIIDRTFLRLSTIFTIIKSFALLSIKKKKYPISKWFGTSLHQKEIKKNPAKPPEIPFHPVSKFLDIYPNPNARSSHPPPFENRHPYNRYPRPFNPSTKNPSQTSNIQLRYPTSRRECQYLILKGGGKQETILDARSHAEYDGWNTLEIRDATLPKWCRVTLLIFG